MNEDVISSEGKTIFEHIQLLPPIMAPPKNAMHGVDNVIVGGVNVGTTNLSCNITAAMTNEKRFRGKDRKQGKRLRRCMQCVEFGGDNAFICKGKNVKNGRNSCIYFDISGQDLTSSLE